MSTLYRHVFVMTQIRRRTMRRLICLYYLPLIQYYFIHGQVVKCTDSMFRTSIVRCLNFKGKYGIIQVQIMNCEGHYKHANCECLDKTANFGKNILVCAFFINIYHFMGKFSRRHIDDVFLLFFFFFFLFFFFIIFSPPSEKRLWLEM